MHGGALYEQAAEDVVPNPAQLAVAKALNSVKGELGTANVTSGLWGSSAACTKLNHNKGASIKYVRRFFGFFDPPSLPLYANSRNLAY